MERSECLERLMDAFAGSYDITRDELVCGRTVEARAEMRAMNQKYVLSKKHVLWEANAFEQCIFITADTLTADIVTDWWKFLTLTAEEPLIHPGEKYPPEGHMYTYLTAVFVADRVDEDARQLLRRLKFTKNYLWSFRGWATGRALAIDLTDMSVTVNGAGREMQKPIQRILGRT